MAAFSDRLPLLDPDATRTASADETPGTLNRLGELLGGEEPRDVEAPETSEKSPMSDFFVWVGDIKQRMAHFSKNVKRIEAKQTEALTSIYLQAQGVTVPRRCDVGTGQNEELVELMDETQECARTIQADLKKMEEETKKIGSGGSDVRIRTNMHNTLSRKFCELIKKYQDVQEKFKSGYKDRMKRQYLVVNPAASEEEVQKVVDGETDPGAIFAGGQMSLGMAAAQDALADIQSKHREIRKLEDSLGELHQLFMDMAILVETQVSLERCSA